MIQMNRENGVRIDLLCRSDHCFEHSFVGITTSSLGKLDNKRRFGINTSLKQTENLLQIIDIVRSDRVLRVGKLVQRGRCHDHTPPTIAGFCWTRQDGTCALRFST